MAKSTYAQNKAELEIILEKLQDPQTDLDDALKLHEEAKTIIAKMEEYLSDVNTKIKDAG